MTDNEYEELIYLYRVVRAENATPEEVVRCRELLRKWTELRRGKEVSP